MALPQPLEPELLDHLHAEFDLHGHRTANLLEDAHAQLVAGTPPRWLRKIVAHCLREAILDSVDSEQAIPILSRADALQGLVQPAAPTLRQQHDQP